jgi:hypothetical protein
MTDLSDAFSRHCHLLSTAEGYFGNGDYLAAVRLAQVAARYAFPANIGLFASPRLERLLVEIGEKLPTVPAEAPHRSNGPCNILHVLTYARPIGGDSRFVWRWIQEDHNNRHSIVVTAQSEVKEIFNVPEDLVQAAENSGGFFRILNASTTNPLEQARELRGLCQTMDLVILHLFPWDIIPILALADGCDSVKTIFINHSDHTYWVGASVAHAVVHLRRQSPEFLNKRRRLHPENNIVLPIPLDYVSPTVSRAEAKHALGIAANTVLLLTIASPFKYEALGQVAFLDLVIPVLLEYPQAILIAVGPGSKGMWQSASIQTDGRIKPLGIQWDNKLLYTAADIYLDSVPFSSITSLLEAGSHGAALLGHYPPNCEMELLGPGAPGLENVMDMANEKGSYQALLSRLITDEQLRHQHGQAVKKKILSLHTGKNWVKLVHDIYTFVNGCNDRGCIVGNNDAISVGELDLALIKLYSGQPRSFRRLIRSCIGSLPYINRAVITWKLYWIGFDLSFLNLIPPPMDKIIHRVGRKLKRILITHKAQQL